jgi:hypothetical protein
MIESGTIGLLEYNSLRHVLWTAIAEGVKPRLKCPLS